jgi:DNA-binding transcriptional ArsR family regulator
MVGTIDATRRGGNKGKPMAGTHAKSEPCALKPAALREHATDAARLMKALGNENRLMILCVLAEGELSVGELNERIPLSQSALSQQLSRLRTEGLVTTRRESQTIFYALSPGPADRIIKVLHDIYCGA